MTETGYQTKIIKSIISDGGTAITGIFIAGEADIQAGVPTEVLIYVPDTEQHGTHIPKTILRNITIEVKTPENYDRVMRALEIQDGLYVIVNPVPLKKHEKLQIFKLNNMRKRGGLALVAHSYEQVKDYINANK